MPAKRPWSSDSLPSVAETRLVESGVNSTGSEPDCSTSAMSLASCALSRPVICALPPLMPSGLSRKSIVGKVVSLLSRTTAKRCRNACCEPSGASPLATAWSYRLLAAVGEVVRDLLEDVAAAPVEVHRDDGRAGLRVEVRPRPVQVGARQQPVPGRDVEHVPVGLLGLRVVGVRRDVGRAAGRRPRGARDGQLALRDAEHLDVVGQLRDLELLLQLLLVGGAGRVQRLRRSCPPGTRTARTLPSRSACGSAAFSSSYSEFFGVMPPPSTTERETPSVRPSSRSMK